MAIKLLDKTNVQPEDSDYIYGRIKDDTGVGDGTPVDVETYGDFHQFFARLLDKGGVTPNGFPDNNYSGFQYFEALTKYVGLDAWKLRSDIGDITVVGGSAVVSTSLIKYRRIGKTLHLIFGIGASITSGGTTEFDILLPEGMNNNIGFSTTLLCRISDSGDTPTQQVGLVALSSGSANKLFIGKLTGSFNNGATITIAGSLTIEIA